MFQWFKFFIKRGNHLFFDFKFSFLLFKRVDLSIFSFKFGVKILDFSFKLWKFFLVFKLDLLNDVIVMFLKYLIELIEVSLQHISHSLKVIIQHSELVVQTIIYNAWCICLHLLNDSFNVISAAVSCDHECPLDIHNCLDDQLQLMLFIISCWYIVVFQYLRDSLVKFEERGGKYGFYGWHLHNLTFF